MIALITMILTSKESESIPRLATRFFLELHFWLRCILRSNSGGKPQTKPSRATLSVCLVLSVMGNTRVLREDLAQFLAHNLYSKIFVARN